MVIIAGGKRNGLLIAFKKLVAYIDMSEFRHVMTQAGIKASSGLRRLVDDFSSANIANWPILLDGLKYPADKVRNAMVRALGCIDDGAAGR